MEIDTSDNVQPSQTHTFKEFPDSALDEDIDGNVEENKVKRYKRRNITGRVGLCRIRKTFHTVHVVHVTFDLILTFKHLSRAVGGF